MALSVPIHDSHLAIADSPEQRITVIGERLLGAMGKSSPELFDVSAWRGRIAVRAMDHDDFRVALLRFVDVLPSVKDDTRLVMLAQEYFETLADQVSPSMGLGIRMLARSGPFKRVTARVMRMQLSALARQFIAGVDLSAAWPTLEKIQSDGGAVSVDLLGEVTHSRKAARHYQQRYLGLLAAWPQVAETGTSGGGWQQVPHLSVKLSALVPWLDPRAWEDSQARAKAALRPILKQARQVGASIQVDMEHHSLKDLTLAVVMGLLEEADFADGPDCGVVLQAYLKDTDADLKRVIDWAQGRERRLSVRLVKGAYWDQEVITHRQAGLSPPVWLHKGDTDRAYERLTRVMLDHAHVIAPAFAGHNPRSIAHAIDAAEQRGMGPDDYEFQVIYGMAEPLRRALVDQGYRVRSYCPLGELLPGMAYLVRRLLENTANTSMLRNMYRDQVDARVVLAPPPVGKPRLTSVETGFINQPLADFSQMTVRQRFADALVRCHQGLGAHHPAVVAGQPVGSGRRLVSSDPARVGQVVGTSVDVGPEGVDHALRVAVDGADAWAATSPGKRANVLERAAELMTQQRWDLAALTVLEVGKGWRDADAEIAEAIDFCRYYAESMRRLATPQRFGTRYPGECNQGGWRPRGVAAVISPWNFPIAIAAGMVGAALVTGNSVVFKPSERAPVCGAALFKLLYDAGVPVDALQFIPGASETGAALANHPMVDMVAFTGSRAVGVKICRGAAEGVGQGRIKHVIAEMGGKNAIIVDETADLDEAVAGIVQSMVGYQGQKCSACSRLIVHEAVHDILVRRLCEAIGSLPIGPPEDPENLMGPLIDARASASVLAAIKNGSAQATTVFKVDATAALERYGGHYVGPVVLTGLSPRHSVVRQEVFGPVLAVLKADSLGEALALANDCDYALTGGLFSRSPAAIEQVKREFKVGNLYINRGITGAQVARQPFGGFRMSGLGTKAGGPGYLPQFMLPITVTENTLRSGFVPGKVA